MLRVSFRVPYIVSTRRNEELKSELEKDDYPVLLEGVHCTWLLNDNKLKGRKVFVRLHNVEHIYYDRLARHERNALKRAFFSRESRLLKKWEMGLLKQQAHFLTVSSRDSALFQSLNHSADVRYLPVFTGHGSPKAHKGFGEFCLYHGNLSVNENEAAAAWLIQEVFETLEINLMIAGKDPSKNLLQLASKYRNIHIVSNPSEPAMNELMARAHIHVLPSFNATGVKLKVLNALYLGRFVVANRNAVEGTAIEELCNIVETPGEFREKISGLMETEYSDSVIRKRYETLEGIYSNEMNALHLSALIFQHYPTPSRPRS